MARSSKPSKPRTLRQRLGLNQQQFWSAVGVTQSGGSRYESGRNMPRPVVELVRLVHVEALICRARAASILRSPVTCATPIPSFTAA